MSPPLISSATKTADSESPGPSESLVETKETWKNKRWDPKAPEATSQEYLQMQYSD